MVRLGAVVVPSQPLARISLDAATPRTTHVFPMITPEVNLAMREGAWSVGLGIALPTVAIAGPATPVNARGTAPGTCDSGAPNASGANGASETCDVPIARHVGDASAHAPFWMIVPQLTVTYAP